MISGHNHYREVSDLIHGIISPSHNVYSVPSSHKAAGVFRHMFIAFRPPATCTHVLGTACYSVSQYDFKRDAQIATHPHTFLLKSELDVDFFLIKRMQILKPCFQKAPKSIPVRSISIVFFFFYGDRSVSLRTPSSSKRESVACVRSSAAMS